MPILLRSLVICRLWYHILGPRSRSPVVAELREAYSLHWRRHPHVYAHIFLLLIPFSLPNGRLCYGEARAGR